MQARHVQLDVTDEKSIARAAEWVEGEHGLLDVLVNNAGIALGDGSGKPSETTVETMRAVFETNVFGVVAVTNAMLPLLRKAPAARPLPGPPAPQPWIVIFTLERLAAGTGWSVIGGGVASLAGRAGGRRPGAWLDPPKPARAR